MRGGVEARGGASVTGDGEVARLDAGGEDDAVEAAQRGGADAREQLHVDAAERQQEGACMHVG